MAHKKAITKEKTTKNNIANPKHPVEVFDVAD